ncbi:hypothetical protein BC829DRAFT_103031 [Chytridium lagenaria]|nr:hypothetical protein BC829DRAFT_103031 [Chytridium lagenaria]
MLLKNLILLASTIALAVCGDAASSRASRHAPRAAPAEYETLARTYAPLVRFHPSEQYFSTSVDYFLSKVYMQDGNGNRVPNQPPLTPYNLDFLRQAGQDDTGKFLWVDGNVKATPDLPGELAFLKGSSNMNGVPMYAFIVPKSNGVVDIFYWHFSPYNLGKNTPLGWVDDHVGDWERFIIVRTVNGQAVSLDYYTHGGQGVRVVPANDKRVQWVGTHPVVYTALGSHGMWPQAAKNTYKTVVLVYDLVDETGDNGSQWQTWNNVSTIMYRPYGGYTGAESFLNYKGRYGNKGETDCWYYSAAGSCTLATGPEGPSRWLLGPPGQVLASPGGDTSTVTFYIDAGTAKNAANLGLGFVGVHLHCPGTNILGDNGDVERWGVVGFKGTGDLKYTITTDRCRKGRDRHVDNYEVAFCTSTDSNSCGRKSGYRNVKVFNAGSETKSLGVAIADPDPWGWNL